MEFFLFTTTPWALTKEVNRLNKKIFIRGQNKACTHGHACYSGVMQNSKTAVMAGGNSPLVNAAEMVELESTLDTLIETSLLSDHVYVLFRKAVDALQDDLTAKGIQGKWGVK